MTVDPDLLEVLACPKDGASLVRSDSDAALTCTRCGTEYPIHDGVPVLLLDTSQRE